ncbi:Sulfide dehydrogenase [flavocytochrome C] flavoprotein chain precursor [Thioalkalivibrio nitratireducens DSM 14787]|uniref:Sulfide dehydrogenase [flavocytochrome C] flavoprotein chain n=1 Tax=Thioalkalivibrio nitratireducens (strain DSM 14787 / UNIQEM 213 / ALEN2) TaxID=1255043 RepID=L0DTB7_THIND|nr:NAD(P)/FAD-dependent oxidoreductase [Thioalkalivibrio nitratireducens]AGA32253.1 Sulfide dehydrogenase [flavocytochrome C] flavoprotein chain precursor [Thioalkalivibrio nitratireducens DSM 14787]
MANVTRRNFLKAIGIGGAAAATGFGCAANGTVADARSAHVVVVGGGSGGATAAKYLKRFSPEMQVTLIEPNATYYTCYGSNWVIGGHALMDDIKHTYGALKDRHGVNVVQDTVTEVDPARRTVRTAGGATMNYDRLIMSPGIDFRYDAVPGITAADAERIPHAWKAGEQTRLLRSQLEAMPNGGVFVMVAPGNPFRCPPGPYERASMVAHYFKQAKPRSKIIILDNKENFSKQGLFMSGWEQHYGEMIEWVPSSQGGQVEEIDAANLTAISDAGFTRIKADVLNYIPPQSAGAIAQQAGLVGDTFWCPVNQLTFESSIHPGIYVIGDSSVAGAMPKSGHSANNQAKVAAAAIVRELSGQEPLMPSTANTCYSLITPDHAISVAAVYAYKDGTISAVEGAGGVSPADAPASFRQQEALYTKGWYDGITADIWG